MILPHTPIAGLLASGGLLCIGSLWSFLGSAATTVTKLLTGKSATEANYEKMYNEAKTEIAAGQVEIVKLKQSKTTTYLILGILAVFVLAGFFLFKRK